MFRNNYQNMFNTQENDFGALPVYKIGVNPPSLINPNLNVVNRAGGGSENSLGIGGTSKLASSLLGGMKTRGETTGGETTGGLNVGSMSNMLGSLSGGTKDKGEGHDWGNTLTSAGTGAATGFSVGGPWGALVGALLGAGSSFLSDL